MITQSTLKSTAPSNSGSGERVTKRVFLDYVYEHHMRGCCGLNRIDGKGHIANKAVEPQMSEYINKVVGNHDRKACFRFVVKTAPKTAAAGKQ